MALIADITHASGYALRVLAFLKWFFFLGAYILPMHFLDRRKLHIGPSINRPLLAGHVRIDR